MAVWATCTLPDLWCWESSVLAGVDWQGAWGREGQAHLSYPLVIHFGRGPVAAAGESDLPEGWIHRSTALGVCAVQASSLAGTGSLWDFGWGMGEEDGAGQCLCSLPSWALSSGAQQLSLPLSSSPPVLRAEVLAYNLPDVKSHLLSEHTSSGPSTFASQTRGLCLASGLPLRPSSLPPVRGALTLSTLFRGPLICAWLRRIRSASLLAVFWVI